MLGVASLMLFRILIIKIAVLRVSGHISTILIVYILGQLLDSSSSVMKNNRESYFLQFIRNWIRLSSLSVENNLIILDLMVKSLKFSLV